MIHNSIIIISLAKWRNYISVRRFNLDNYYPFLVLMLVVIVPQPQIRLFQNRWLERLTVISAQNFMVLWVAGLPFIAVQAWGTADAGIATLLVTVGVLTWTLSEYALHRFVFHWDPASATLKKIVFIMHGNHHHVPNDPLRNLMPPIISLPVGGLIWAAMLALVGLAGSWLFLGFMGGYVVYDLVHYGCHQWPMKGRLARLLKTHHMHHHHRHEIGNFAITGMMWDRLFHTRIAQKAHV